MNQPSSPQIKIANTIPHESRSNRTPPMRMTRITAGICISPPANECSRRSRPSSVGHQRWYQSRGKSLRLFGQCAFLTQLTKENSLLRVSHFDSHTPRPHRLLPMSVSRGLTHELHHGRVGAVLATLFGLDAFEVALAIFIAAFLIHLCRCG